MIVSNFLPIPSLNNQYEINSQGVVRNVRTKRELQPFISFANPKTTKTIASLLWEVHGIKPKGQNTRAISVSCTDKKGKTYNFNSLKDCAKFLAPKTHYPIRSLEDYMSRRKTEIGEWTMKYFCEPKIVHREENQK